ncbi:FHA domain protein [Ceratobasidium sp. AG-Ba]|nr:FHA domain protein [Ceratobasidium sp. AG-Ba]
MEFGGDMNFTGLGLFRHSPSTGGPMSSTPFSEMPHMRVIGINITFTSPGKPQIRRSFLRSEFKSIHLGREPADACGVANAFARGDVVPPVMSRKHAEIVWVHDAPQVMDIGSYHGTYFRGVAQRLMPNKPYPLWDGSILEFGKSVTKDEKAHDPLTATIEFIREADRMSIGLGSGMGVGRAQKDPSGLFSPSSPPRRYAMPSDSEEEEDDEDDDEDEDLDDSEGSSSGSRSDIFEYTPEGVTRPHIDLTNMSDDDNRAFGYSTAPDTDGIECIGFGYAPGAKSLYDEDRAESSSDMSESENEAEVVAPAPQRIVQGGVSSLEAAAHVHVPSVVPQEPRVVVEVPRPVEVSAGPSEEVRGLRAELDRAMHEIVGLKAVLKRKEHEEQERIEKDKDGDVQIVEQPAQDVPSRIANIENMVQQLATVGDVEICEHRTTIQAMLGQLASGIEALRVRVGGEPSSPQSNNKRKRVDDDGEEEEQVEARRAQSPMPALQLISTPVQVSPPSPAPPAKRSRIGTSTLVVAGGAAMWGALAFNLI